ncbi:MAG: hypothetical protein ACREVJ_00095 [Gammaproteobacteria bacterium]
MGQRPRLEANEKVYQGLLKRYTVTIERSRPAQREKKLVAVNAK